MTNNKNTGKKLVLPQKMEENFNLFKIGLVFFVILFWLVFAFFKFNQKVPNNPLSGILYSLKEDEVDVKIIEKEVLQNTEKSIELKEIKDGETEQKSVLKSPQFGDLETLENSLKYKPITGFLGQDSIKLELDKQQFLIKLNVINCNGTAGDSVPDCEVKCDYDTQNEIQDCVKEVCETENILDNGAPFCSLKNAVPESKDLVYLVEPGVKDETLNIKEFILNNIKDPDNSLPLKIQNISFLDKLVENEERVILNVGKSNILTFDKKTGEFKISLGVELGENYFFFNVKDAFGAENLIQKLILKVDCAAEDKWNEEKKVCEKRVVKDDLKTDKCLETTEILDKNGICTLALKENPKDYFSDNLKLQNENGLSNECKVFKEDLKIPFKINSFLKCENVINSSQKIGSSSEKYFLNESGVQTDVKIIKNVNFVDCAGVGVKEENGVKSCNCEADKKYDPATRKCEENFNLESLVYTFKPGEKINLKEKNPELKNDENVEVLGADTVKKLSLKVLKNQKEYNQIIYVNSRCEDGQIWKDGTCKTDIFAKEIECQNGVQNAVEGGVLKCNLGKINLDDDYVLSANLPENGESKCEFKDGESWCNFVYLSERDFYLWKKEEGWKSVNKVLVKINHINCADNTFADKNSNTCKACPSGEFLNEEKTGCEKCQFNTIFNSQTGKCEACAMGEYPNFNKNSCVVCNDVKEDNIPDCQVDCEDGKCLVCKENCEDKKEGASNKNLKLCEINEESDNGIGQCPKLPKCDNVAGNGIDDCKSEKVGENCDTVADNGVLNCQEIKENILNFTDLKLNWSESIKMSYPANYFNLKIDKDGENIDFKIEKESLVLNTEKLKFGENILNYWLEDKYGKSSDKKQFKVIFSCENEEIYDERQNICAKEIDLEKLGECKNYPAVLNQSQYFNCNFKLEEKNNVLPKGGINFKNENGVVYPCFILKREEGEFLNCSNYTTSLNNYFELINGENTKKIKLEVGQKESLNDFSCDNSPKNDVHDCFSDSDKCDYEQDNGVENCIKNENICKNYDEGVEKFILKGKKWEGEILKSCEKGVEKYSLNKLKTYFILNDSSKFNNENNILNLFGTIKILSQNKIEFNGENYTLKTETKEGFNIYEITAEDEQITLKFKNEIKNYIPLTVLFAAVLLFIHRKNLKNINFKRFGGIKNRKTEKLTVNISENQAEQIKTDSKPKVLPKTVIQSKPLTNPISKDKKKIVF